MLGLAMQLGLATPLAFMAPHPAPVTPQPPAPVVAAVPHELGPPSNGRGAPVAAIRGGGGDQAQGEPSTTTTVPPTVTTSTGLECVVTLSAPDGTHVTYSPGPAVNGACSQGVPEPYTVTGP